MDEAIVIGDTLGTMCVTHVRTQYRWPKVRVLW